MPQATMEVRHKTDSKKDNVFHFNVFVGDIFAKIKPECLEKCGRNVKICQQKRIALEEEGKSLRDVPDDFPIYGNTSYDGN